MKSLIIKNTTKFKVNTFCFYAFNGNCSVKTNNNSKQESVKNLLMAIRLRNPFNPIIMIMDTELIFLPPYSQQLNPIEPLEIHKKSNFKCLYERSEYDGENDQNEFH